MANKRTEFWDSGINGSGHQVWQVATFVNEQCVHIETFDNEAEARTWLVWA